MNEPMLHGAGRAIALSGTLTVGRSTDCAVVLTEGHPSRQHAEISVTDDGVWVTDLGSANGTFVNDRPVTKRTQLRSGDRVRFDIEEFQFLLAGEDTGGDDQATVLREDQRGAEPDHETVVPHGSGERRPGSWADPDARDEQGTLLMDTGELSPDRDAAGADFEAATPDALAAPYLQVSSGLAAGTRLKLGPSQQTSMWEVGSESERDIVLTDEGVSGFHAKIVNEGARWKVIDQMSANGTYVNARKSNISYMASGDRVRFGPVECVFHLPESAQAAAEPVQTGFNWRGSLIAFAVVLALLLAGIVLIG
jgi:pSer/pThr/pTyr-binding forkhead associated (FHA) protein